MDPQRKKELESSYQRVLSYPVPKDKLIAVSKTFPFDDVAILYSLGHRDFGENKVQDLALKAELAQNANLSEIRWHMIGHLQSNKIKKLLETPHLHSIHSVDSLELLQKLVDQRQLLKNHVGLFFEMNTSGETSKFGIQGLEELKVLVERFQKLETGRFFFQGLMTLGPHPDNPTKGPRESFGALRAARDKLNMETLQLSMGMSSDYPVALELGADYIRIGTNIFGKRDPL